MRRFPDSSNNLTGTRASGNAAAAISSGTETAVRQPWLGSAMTTAAQSAVMSEADSIANASDSPRVTALGL